MDFRNLSDASAVLTALVRDATTVFADELDLFGAWIESPTTICVVYRRRIEPDQTLGRRVKFPPHAVEGDPGSTGADVAQSLVEPAGDGLGRGRNVDNVLWLFLGADDAPPRWPGSRPSDSRS